jgi:hypothetical protein
MPKIKKTSKRKKQNKLRPFFTKLTSTRKSLLLLVIPVVAVVGVMQLRPSRALADVKCDSVQHPIPGGGLTDTQPTLAFGPSTNAALSTPGNILVTARGLDGAVWYQTMHLPGGARWWDYGWTSLGGKIYGSPAAGANYPKNPSYSISSYWWVINATGLDYRNWRNENWGSGWTGWKPIPSVVTPKPKSWEKVDNTYYYVYRHPDNTIWYQCFNGY